MTKDDPPTRARIQLVERQAVFSRRTKTLVEAGFANKVEVHQHSPVTWMENIAEEREESRITPDAIQGNKSN